MSTIEVVIPPDPTWFRSPIIGPRLEQGLYVAEFPDGWVKIGRAAKLPARIRAHIDAGALRWTVAPMATSPHTKRTAHSSALGNAEHRALTRVNGLPGIERAGDEWFRGLPFEDAAAIIRAAVAVQPIPVLIEIDDESDS